VGDNAPDSPPAIVAAGGYLRLIGLHGKKVFEQRCDLKSGAAVGSAAELVVPVNLSEPLVDYWLKAALTVALAFSLMATAYRHVLWARRGVEIIPPTPAPLLHRAGAGFIDALPVLIGFLIVVLRVDPSLDPRDRWEDVPALITLGAAIALYLLHTTVSELLTGGRTVGKWLFGLTVVTLDGAEPTAGQVLVRNLLRVLDLLLFPLLLVLLPLRQRSADMAAGTVVVRLEDLRKPTADSGHGSGGEDNHAA
jgi:uncharacterized RDD family membrane protein YckC